VRQLAPDPFVRPAWAERYKDEGLVVFHTPEFSFEHEIDRVRKPPIADRTL
jgi:hypothetical protein